MKLSSVLALAVSSAPTALCGNNTSDSPIKGQVGAVFALLNTAPQNKIAAFARNADGVLTKAGEYLTDGIGIGADLDSQGEIVLNDDNSFLYAVNPADDSVSVFAVEGAKLSKVQTVYAGDLPIAISLSSTGYAYVLDGSTAGNGIFGFKVHDTEGTLTPLTNKTVGLSSPIGVPGDVIFSPDGTAIVVLSKATNVMDVFAVDAEGHASATPETTIVSSGPRPFAGAFNNGTTLYVVESGLPSLQNSAVSSYRLNRGDAPSLTAITKSAKNFQTDGCWIVVTPNQRYAYASNAFSDSISSFKLDSNGTTSLIDARAGLPGVGSQPLDLALSRDGQYLYNLLRGPGAIAGFKIGKDGSLKQVDDIIGQGIIPANYGVSGLAAF